MTGGYSQNARILCNIVPKPDWGNKRNRNSSDDVWPLRRADGSKLYEQPHSSVTDKAPVAQ